MTSRSVNPNSKPLRSKLPVPARVQQFATVGTPLLIEPADDRAYNELLVSICAAVKPANVLEEMFVADVVILHWEILALRRFKSSLIAKITYEELRDFLHSAIDYDMVRADFEQRLVQELQANWPEDENEKLAKKLARQCVEDEPEAVEKVNQILGTVEESSQSIFWSVKEEKAEEFCAIVYATRQGCY